MVMRRELMDKEIEIMERHCEAARGELQEWIQARADTDRAVDGQGRPLTHRERIPMKIRSVFGSFSVTVVSGYSEQDGKTLTPLRERLFGGARGVLTPLLERNIAHLGLECGSFEKAARLCADWGVAVSDDKVMDTVRSVGARCVAAALPETCADAAGPGDVLVLMADGWNARHRGPRWGEDGAPREERVEWKDIKSGVMFKMSHVVDAGAGRKALLTKHVVAVPADAGPEVFGEAMEREALRMGLARAKRAYFFSDGGAYLWNMYEYRFEAVAVGTLDYYHAMEHLGEAAAELFPDRPEREQWLKAMRAEIREKGGRGLAGTLSELLAGASVAEAGARVVEREIKYFEKHSGHMDYGKRREEGVPIGSGSVESLCGQFQDRLKRRGQFWTRKGFALFLRAYVWYMNGELEYAIDRPAA